MKSPFTPAITLMNNLKYPQKFLLIGLLMVLPLGLVMRDYVQQVSISVDFGAKEQLGLQYNLPLTHFLQLAQKHSALAILTSGGVIAFKPDFDANEAALNASIKEIDGVNQRVGGTLGVSAQWAAVKKDWQDMQSMMSSMGAMAAQDTLDAHAKIDNEILALITAVGNNSNLYPHPDIDTYYIMDTITTKLPTTTEYLAQVRNYGLVAAIRNSLSPEEKSRLIIVSGLVTSNFDANLTNFGYMFGYNASLKGPIQDKLTAAKNQVDTFLASVNKDVISRASAAAFSPARLSLTP